MGDEFTPANDLEVSLLKAQTENAPLTSILPEIILSGLIVLAKGANVENPLFLTSNGGITVLATFTSIERSKKMQLENPDYEFALEVACGNLFLGLPEGTGLVINPGLTVGLALEPEVVDQIKNSIKMD